MRASHILDHIKEGGILSEKKAKPKENIAFLNARAERNAMGCEHANLAFKHRAIAYRDGKACAGA